MAKNHLNLHIYLYT